MLLERLSASVMDGISVGHTRCNVDHCCNRLKLPRDRFCPAHHALESKCAIPECLNAVRPGARTCSTSSHRSVEDVGRARGQAIFRLKKRLQTTASEAGVASTSSPDGDIDVIDDPDVASELQKEIEDAACQGKSSTKSGYKTRLTRRWTHNEQLLFRCCGVITSRATFFEAESPSNAYRFLQGTFPEVLKGAMPSFIFFDNNCKLLRHLRANNDTRFQDVGFPVDVFHAVNKHKDSDAYCQLNCNPAGFKELFDKLNRWLFNSSAAEQGNVWFGKFKTVVREMGEVRYNFFLDEMIMIHNEWRVSVLRARGAQPRHLPEGELRRAF
ncbi:hypothetical protein C8Q76DRAFT_727675 [Earliella scabrosa]|nr:hypothetical protein C8Q76DRAFT_727675 [Earliella scabrosa]